MPTLTSFGIGNYKAFDSLSMFRVRPITLLFGTNSCGKSALLRSLLRARAFTERLPSMSLAYAEHYRDASTYDYEHDKLLNVQDVDCGTYPDFLHSEGNTLTTFSWEWRTTSSDECAQMLFKDCVTIRYTTRVGLASDKDSTHVIGHTSVAVDDDILFLSNRYVKDSQLLRHIVQTIVSETLPANDRAWLLNHIDDFSALCVDSFLSYRDDHISSLHYDDPLRRTMESHNCLPSDPGPRFFNESADEDTAWDIDGSFSPQALLQQSWQPYKFWHALVHKTPRPQAALDALRKAESSVVVHLGKLLVSLFCCSASLFSNSTYLGPIRRIPGSDIAAQDDKSNKTDQWVHLAQSADARHKVNAWLKTLMPDSSLSISVELKGKGVPLSPAQRQALRELLLDNVKDVLSYHELDIMTDTTLSRVPSVESISSNEVAELWTRLISTHALDETVVSIKMSIPHSGSKGGSKAVRPADVGVGVSQIVPILVAGATSSDSLLLVEQPELHLHPRMQAELADFFIETALGESGNSWIIETHSEHLLLRFIRRIREHLRREDSPHQPALKPSDIAICFVERDGDQSRVYEVPLDANGLPTRPWPEGFFETGFREVMAW